LAIFGPVVTGPLNLAGQAPSTLAVDIELNLSVFRKHIVSIVSATVFKLILMPILAWFMCHWLGLDPAATVAVVLCPSVAAVKC